MIWTVAVPARDASVESVTIRAFITRRRAERFAAESGGIVRGVKF